MIQPDHPLVLQEHSLWLSIAEWAFQSGQYVQEDEIEAHAELTGASVKDSYLTLNGKYQLNLIGSQSGKLPAKLAKSIMSWVWERPDGIRYLGQPLKTPPGFKPEVVDHWLSSLALTLLRFLYVYHHTQHAIDWLLSQRTVDGYWDFGPCPRRSTFFPLSENWLNPNPDKPEPNREKKRWKVAQKDGSKGILNLCFLCKNFTDKILSIAGLIGPHEYSASLLIITDVIDQPGKFDLVHPANLSTWPGRIPSWSSYKGFHPASILIL